MAIKVKNDFYGKEISRKVWAGKLSSNSGHGDETLLGPEPGTGERGSNEKAARETWNPIRAANRFLDGPDSIETLTLF